MKYRLFLIMATAVVLGSTLSCSQNEVVTNDGDQKDPISFNVNVGTLPEPEVSTRGYSTSQAPNGYTFTGGEYVCVGITGDGVVRPADEIKQYTVAAGNSGGNALTYQKDANGTSSSAGFSWLSKSETVTIRAWSDGKTTTAAPAVDPDGQPFTVETTQTGDVKELLYSPATSYAYTSAINIPLYHQLARIVVTIVRANTSTPISSVTIGHNSTPVPITGTFTKPGAGVNYGTWSVTGSDVITPKEETAGSVYSAVVIPGGATEYPANTRLFNITIGSEVFAYKIPTGGLTLEAGKQYNYTITVENMGITVTSNITDWDAGSYSPGDELVFSRPTMPIEYLVGTTNMAATSDDVSGNVYIATTHKMARGNTPQETAYFRHSTAVDKFSHVSVVEPNGVSVGNYHLARTKEWMSILPPYWITNNLGGTLTISGSNGDRIEFGTNVQNTNKQESAAWGAVWNGSSYTYQVDNVFKNDYFCPSGTTIGYGLRFKDNTTGSNCRYTCAFRYEYKATDASVGGGASLTIQSIYVGRNPNITITTISDEAWWSSSTDVITIVFPATGIAWPAENNYDYPSGTYSSSVINDKSWGWFRSRDEESSTQGYTVIFQDTRVYGNNTSRKAYSIPVRLFRDAE